MKRIQELHTSDLKEVVKDIKVIAYNKNYPKSNMQGNSYSFKINLATLVTRFSKLGYSIQKGNRRPTNETEVGIQSFLQSIYDSIDRSGVDSLAKTVTALEMLGIENIKYCPYNITTEMILKPMEKLYTDGTFMYRHMATVNCYDIDNLTFNKYLLKVNKNPDYTVNVEDSYAILRTLDIVDDLPNVDELALLEYPLVMPIVKEPIEWGASYPAREVFNKFDQNKEFQERYKVLMK